MSENTLADLMAGAASVEVAETILAHVDDCEACRAVLHELARTMSVPLPATEAPTTPGDAPERPVAPGTTVGRYVVMQTVGAGAMGVVYGAYDPELDRRVALKLVNAKRSLATGTQRDTSARLAREARALARVVDPHVVAVHDVGYFGERVFVVMEYVDGTTLREWLDEPRDWRAVLAAFAAAGRGLAAAHRAGIVHRDFKPENVLLGTDGRVRVADFGLAIERAEGGAGSFAGTMAYMAPEQLDGRGADARSDQFAFATALYEALFGDRPFSVARSVERAASIAAGPARLARAPTGHLARVHRALVRALSLDPADRFPTVDDLTRELVPRPRRVLLGSAAGALAVALLAVGYAVRARMAPSPLSCGGAERQLVGIWDEARKERVRSAFAAVPAAPFAATSLAGIEAALDAYGRDWVEVHETSCAATRVRGERSEAVLDRSMACLGERRASLDALATVLEHADRATIEHAVDAAGALEDVRTCGDPRFLAEPRRTPVSPELRARADAVTATITRLKAEDDVAHYETVRREVQGAIDEARAVGDTRLVARGELLLASALTSTNDVGAAETALLEAVWAAESAAADDTLARAWIELVHVDGALRSRLDDAYRHGRHGEAVLARMGGSPLESRLHAWQAWTLLRAGRYDDAAAKAKVALDEIGAHGMGKSRDAALVLSALTDALRHLGRFAEAKQVSDRDLAIEEARLGPSHPDTAFAMKELGDVEMDLGDYDGALGHFTEAAEVFRVTLGGQTPDSSTTETSIGMAFERTGRRREGREHLARALVIEQKVLGDHPITAHSLENLAECDLDMGRPDASIAGYTNAFAMLDRLPDPYPEIRAEGLVGMGRAQLAVGNPSRARKSLEAAQTFLTDTSYPPVRAGEAFTMARTLSALRMDPARALHLARASRDLYAQSPGFAAELATVDAWLAEHGSDSPVGMRRAVGQDTPRGTPGP